MSALCPHEFSFGAHHNVTVEVQVCLQRAENHEIQFIDDSAFAEGVGIFFCCNRKMLRIGNQILDCRNIKILGIQETGDKAFIQKVAHLFRHTACAESHTNIFLPHFVCETGRGRDGSAADTGLEGEAFLKIG